MAIQIQLAMPQAQPTAAVAFGAEDGADFDTQFSLEQAASGKPSKISPDHVLIKPEQLPARRQQAAANVEAKYQIQAEPSVSIEPVDAEDTALLEQIPTEIGASSATELTSIILISGTAEAISEDEQSLLHLEVNSGEDVPVVEAQAEQTELLDIIGSARSYEPVATAPKIELTELVSTIPSWTARKEAQQQMLESQTPELTVAPELRIESVNDGANDELAAELQQSNKVSEALVKKLSPEQVQLIRAGQGSASASTDVPEQPVANPLPFTETTGERTSTLMSPSLKVETSLEAESQVVDVKELERAPIDTIGLPLPSTSAQLVSDTATNSQMTNNLSVDVQAPHNQQQHHSAENRGANLATDLTLVESKVGELTPDTTQLEQVTIFQQQAQAASVIATPLKSASKSDKNDLSTIGRAPLASMKPSLQGSPSESMPTDGRLSMLKTESEVPVLTAAQTLNTSTATSNPASLVASTVVASATTNSTVPGSLNSLPHATSMTNTTGTVHGRDANSLVSQASIDLTQSNAGHKIVEQVMYQIQQKVQTAEVRLHPEELGAMNIKVSLQQDQLSVQFIVQHAAAKEALEQQMPRLRDLVQQQGMQLAEGQVQQRQSGQQGHSENSGGQQPNRTSGFANDTELDSDMVVANGQMTVRVSDRAVDYYA